MRSPSTKQKRLLQWTFCGLVILTGCNYEFESILQPDRADPNSTFEVPITIDVWSASSGGLPYFGIKLPIGWSVKDSISYDGALSGLLLYSDSLSDSMEDIDTAPAGYYWWVAMASNTVDSLPDGSVLLTPLISSDNQTGTFFIDYMMGDDGWDLNLKRSNGYPISVDAPLTATVTSTNESGAGSLRQAIAEVSSSGEIVFDLTYPATIVLDSQLVIDRNLTITGPAAGTLTVSGNDTDRVFMINPRLTVNMSDLTIANGDADDGGGIYCSENSILSLTNITVSENTAQHHGGGIYCIGSSASLENVTITGNTAEFGGGIYYCPIPTDDGGWGELIEGNEAAEVLLNRQSMGELPIGNESSSSLVNVKVSGNTARIDGGGIYCASYSSLSLSNVTVSGNTAQEGGGGIYFYRASPSFDPVNRSNIYLNQAPSGRDLYAYPPGLDPPPIIPVAVDTFTVMQPTDFHAYPVDNFTFDILHAKLEQVEADLYVSPGGDDANGGLSTSDPLKTISWAQLIILADSLHPHTIYLANGVYGPHTTGEDFPIQLISYVSLAGESEDGVILDANSLSSVMIFDHTRGTTVRNLTVTGGSKGTGGGIYCNYSSPSLSNVTVSGNTANRGGGIYIWDSDASLANVTVSGNTANDDGGGIYMYSDASLANVTVSGNTANNGGGIYCNYSSPSLSNVTVSGNTANNGGGIYCDYSSPSFDTVNRSNIYLNQATTGRDLYVFRHWAVDLDPPPIIPVVVDTFTVMQPTNIYAYPAAYFTFDILQAKLEQVEADLYVSPSGDDANGGLSTSDPLKTISWAQSIIMPDSLHPHTIYLANGVYGTHTTGEDFPIRLISYVSLAGESEDGVILDANSLSSVMIFDHTRGTTVRNLTFTAGGIFCDNSSPSLENVTVNWNGLADSVAIWCFESSPSLVNVTVSRNLAPWGGSAIYCVDSSPSLVNTILWNATPREIYLDNSSITIAYSDVRGGVNNIGTDNSTVNWLDGNIDADPLFCDPDGYDYFLAENSPCVGTGQDGANMGALDAGCGPLAVGTADASMPTSFALHPAYPNPFNPVSTIQYALPQASYVSLIVYDILGREVAMLVDDYMEPGYHRVQWNGQGFASGIYIARLATPGYSKSIKMLLLK